MPLPNLDTVHSFADGVLVFIRKANELGDALEAAFLEFHNRFFEQHEGPNVQPMRATGPPLSAEAKAVVEEALAAAKPQS